MGVCDKICRHCGIVKLEGEKEEKCPLCGRKMEPYKKEKKETKTERP